VLYAQEAREYSLWTLAILCCGVAFVRACRSMAVGAWIAYAVLAAVSLYVFPFSGLVVLGQGVSLAVVADANRRRALAAYVASCVVALLAFAPWLYIMLTNRAMERGLGRIWSAHLGARAIAGPLAKNLRQTFFDIGTPHGGSSRLGAVDAVVSLVVLTAAAYALVFLVRRATPRASSFVIWALCAPAVPLVLSDLLRHGMLVAQSRYFTPLYLGVELAFAYVLWSKMTGAKSAVGPRRLWAGATLAVIAAGFLSCVASARADTWWNKDYEQSRDVANVINRSAAPLVVERVNSSRSLGLAFYLEPSVKLAMRLTCDNCDGRRIRIAAGSRATVDREGSTNVFVLGAAHASAPYRTVGTTVYPIAAEPLGMFRAI
ncbi:MAG: hypothetical protein IAI48_07480, partial [Candidatus Eremiobacteraeota bacterium]|nr:hypothetical protein [Candidatus Eremiobacteraeota bacterium]